MSKIQNYHKEVKDVRCDYFTRTPAAAGSAPYAAQMTRENEVSYLKNRTQEIKTELERINSRLHDMESKQGN